MNNITTVDKKIVIASLLFYKDRLYALIDNRLLKHDQMTHYKNEISKIENVLKKLSLN